MYLEYPNKKTKEEIFKSIPQIELKSINGSNNTSSKLIFGDNLRVMKHLLESEKYKEKIDLIYIDPPFSTNKIFRISEDRANTVSNSLSSNVAFSDIVTGYEFLEFLRERLVLIRELMSKQASIYVHTDYKIGHYVKIIMDEIFGEENFINDLSRIKCNPKNFHRKAFGNIKDMILFYSKTKDYIWNEQKKPFTEEDINRLFKKIDSDGRRYTTIPLHAPGETKNGLTGKEWRGILPPKGRHWRSSPEELEKLDKGGLIEWSKTGVPRKKIYADEKKGMKYQDILEFKDPQYPSYPTEKNIELLKLLISTSSNKNSIVLDCFCGSGTTLLAAQELDRRWIGIDNSKKAIEVAKKRLIKRMQDSETSEKVQFFDYLEEVERM